MRRILCEYDKGKITTFYFEGYGLIIMSKPLKTKL